MITETVCANCQRVINFAPVRECPACGRCPHCGDKIEVGYEHNYCPTCWPEGATANDEDDDDDATGEK